MVTIGKSKKLTKWNSIFVSIHTESSKVHTTKRIEDDSKNEGPSGPTPNSHTPTSNMKHQKSPSNRESVGLHKSSVLDSQRLLF